MLVIEDKLEMVQTEQTPRGWWRGHWRRVGRHGDRYRHLFPGGPLDADESRILSGFLKVVVEAAKYSYDCDHAKGDPGGCSCFLVYLIIRR